ncbi:MAG: ABC transporter ATP-binding protein [Pseudomonadota bacterium]
MKALDIQGLEKTYANGVRALDGVDLSVEEGDFFALLGPNGAGKSTLIGIVSSLVNMSAGGVRVFDADIARERSRAMSMLGLVPQEVNFNQFERPWDIIINQAGYYGVPRRQAKERCEMLLNELKLWDKRMDLSRELSGGMKRRLMIARAMIHDPRLLILDEPTAGVDIEIRRSMWRYISKINEAGTTVILTTHYLEEAEQLCRNVAIIDHGTIVENTTVKNLISQLDVETFVFDLAEDIAAAPTIEDYEISMRDARTLEISVPKTRPINQLFDALGQAGITVLSMRNKANRLEELFIRLVEKSGPPEEPADVS